MKKGLKITIIAMVLMLSSTALKTFARTYCADEIKYEINKQVPQNYTKYTDADIVSTVTAVPFQKLNLPQGTIKFVVTPINNKFMQHDINKVQIFVDGNLVKNFNVPIELKAYKNVLVASTVILRDQVLTPELVTTKKMEVAQNLDYVLTSDMLSKDIIYKKNFKEGDVIDKRFVKLRPDVLRNNQVTAYFKTNNITVSVEGVAMSDGSKGDYVGVQCKQYNKVYTAKVIGENKVLIEL